MGMRNVTQVNADIKIFSIQVKLTPLVLFVYLSRISLYLYPTQYVNIWKGLIFLPLSSGVPNLMPFRWIWTIQVLRLQCPERDYGTSSAKHLVGEDWFKWLWVTCFHLEPITRCTHSTVRVYRTNHSSYIMLSHKTFTNLNIKNKQVILNLHVWIQAINYYMLRVPGMKYKTDRLCWL